MRLKHLAISCVAVSLVTAAAGCDSLSGQEKRMVGDYYQSAISDNVPRYELRDDRSATVRMLVDGVEVSVCGKWRVRKDSLVIDTDASTLAIDGGDLATVKIEVPGHIAHPIISFNDITLSLRHSDGLQYDYHRRYHAPSAK